MVYYSKSGSQRTVFTLVPAPHTPVCTGQCCEAGCLPALAVGLHHRRGTPQLGDSELLLVAGPFACPLLQREKEIDFPLSQNVSRSLPETQEGAGFFSRALYPNGDPISSSSGCLRCKDPHSSLCSEGSGPYGSVKITRDNKITRDHCFPTVGIVDT